MGASQQSTNDQPRSGADILHLPTPAVHALASACGRCSNDRIGAVKRTKAKPKRAVEAVVPLLTPQPENPKESVAKCPMPPEMDKTEPQLKHLGGSIHDDWNQTL